MKAAAIKKCREYNDYTLEGMISLGECVAHWRKAPKPHWEPVNASTMSPGELERQRTRVWTQGDLAKIINTEFQRTGSKAFNQSSISRLESGFTQQPNIVLIELIADLQICLNPQTNQPFTDRDMLAIAKGLLDWRTGECLSPA